MEKSPTQVQYQTFNRIIDYLLESNKIILNDNEIVWVFPDNLTLKKALANSTRVR
jgi:S-adenosylmethionine:tRNA-ribosyltransferase-isomerase (queuine synthetase)